MAMFNYTQLKESEVDFVEIGPADLPNGERLFVEIEDKPIVVFNIAGQYFAIRDVCTHDDGPLGDGELEDHTVVCPRHGGEFDVRTGKALMLPAVIDIPAYPVRIVNGNIELGIPKE
jgi:3-phenylpropionate/trans-cinnamate dioxygenase ferredoxin component